MAKKPLTSKKFNKMIDEAIDQLSDDRVDSGINILYKLAELFKSAGASRESFAEICAYIEREAIERTDEAFIEMKINAALKKARESKHGLIITKHWLWHEADYRAGIGVNLERVCLVVQGKNAAYDWAEVAESYKVEANRWIAF